MIFCNFMEIWVDFLQFFVISSNFQSIFANFSSQIPQNRLWSPLWQPKMNKIHNYRPWLHYYTIPSKKATITHQQQTEIHPDKVQHNRTLIYASQTNKKKFSFFFFSCSTCFFCSKLFFLELHLDTKKPLYQFVSSHSTHKRIRRTP